MKISALIASVIKQEEGFSLTAYADGAGKTTVGWGHLSHDLSVGDTITVKEAEDFFAEDIEKCETAIKNNVLRDLTQNQFDALADFCFNFGEDKFKSSGMLRELNAGRYGEATKRMMLWNKIRQPDGSYRVSKGLKRRRQREVNIFERGDYSDPRLSV